MSSINQFPWQDGILRELRAGGAQSIDQISAAVVAEGEKGVDSDALREGIALNVDHLVHLGLVAYSDGRPSPSTHTGDEALFHRMVALTPSGESAADSLP